MDKHRKRNELGAITERGNSSCKPVMGDNSEKEKQLGAIIRRDNSSCRPLLEVRHGLWLRTLTRVCRELYSAIATHNGGFPHAPGFSIKEERMENGK